MFPLRRLALTGCFPCQSKLKELLKVQRQKSKCFLQFMIAYSVGLNNFDFTQNRRERESERERERKRERASIAVAISVT